MTGKNNTIPLVRTDNPIKMLLIIMEGILWLMNPSRKKYTAKRNSNTNNVSVSNWLATNAEWISVANNSVAIFEIEGSLNRRDDIRYTRITENRLSRI